MRPAERREEIIKRFLIHQVHHRQTGAPLIPVAFENIVVTHREIEQIARPDARWIVIVVLSPGRWNAYQRRRILRSRAKARRIDRRGRCGVNTAASQAGFVLLVGR